MNNANVRKEIFINALDIIEDNGYYGRRYSDKQYKYLKDSCEDYRIRSLCSPNIYLNFRKISKEDMVLNFEINDFARETVNVDIYLNDILYKHIEFEKNSKKISIVLGDEYINQEVSIFLQNTCSWKLVHIQGEYELVSKKQNTRLLILGDSISQGMETEFPSLTYSNLLMRNFNFNIINQSCGGIRFDKKIIEYCEVKNPEYVIVALGTNDILSDIDTEQLLSNIDDYFKALENTFFSSKIFVITPIFILGDNINLDKRERIIKKILDNTKMYSNITLVNGENMIPYCDYFYYDKTIHPNDEGNFLMYLCLEKLFRRS